MIATRSSSLLPAQATQTTMSAYRIKCGFAYHPQKRVCMVFWKDIAPPQLTLPLAQQAIYAAKMGRRSMEVRRWSDRG
jgi:hypothetical protein